MTLEQILAKARELAIEYYKLTKKPLGITGEIGRVRGVAEARTYPV